MDNVIRSLDHKEEGHKDDKGKARWDLAQPLALQEYVKVLTHGANKYGVDNWRSVENANRRYFSACLRHVWAWWKGEYLDPESGCHHLAHAICCAAFLLEVELEAPDAQVPPAPKRPKK